MHVWYMYKASTKCKSYFQRTNYYHFFLFYFIYFFFFLQFVGRQVFEPPKMQLICSRSGDIAAVAFLFVKNEQNEVFFFLIFFINICIMLSTTMERRERERERIFFLCDVFTFGLFGWSRLPTFWSKFFR